MNIWKGIQQLLYLKLCYEKNILPFPVIASVDFLPL